MNDLRVLRADLVAAERRYQDVESQYPRASEFSQVRQHAASTALFTAKSAAAEGLQVLVSLRELVDQKLGATHLPIRSDRMPTVAHAVAIDKSIATTCGSLGLLASAHNAEVDGFEQAKIAAALSLKGHLLALGQSGYNELAEGYEKSQAKSAEADKQVKELRADEERLRNTLRSHGPAAERINSLIHNYLGRKDLELVTADQGYRLRRNGRLVQGSLSEGEKTAIAICYFITTLEAENRKRKDLIVVIDDPVSSLDTRALNYSFNILRAMVRGACQVFLLTHNLQFMNEARKWLYRMTPSGLERAKKDASGATAALLFLDVVQPGGPETRACALLDLPKHIRDYESEYHYLLHLLFKFVETPDATEYFFLMPNAMRKVLDVFLAFKIPGADGLGSKVDKLVKEIEGVDPARIHALVALAQVESHSDNLDDLITFSSATVEEVREAARTLIEVIKRMDETHLHDMKKLCA